MVSGKPPNVRMINNDKKQTPNHRKMLHGALVSVLKERQSKDIFEENQHGQLQTPMLPSLARPTMARVDTSKLKLGQKGKVNEPVPGLSAPLRSPGISEFRCVGAGNALLTHFVTPQRVDPWRRTCAGNTH